MDDFQLSDDMRDELRGAWHRYLDKVTPFRPLLHGYCRKLTRNLWDAEDLAQDTLLRGFHHLAYHHDPIQSPRAYLLRIATHAWIDTLRRRETEAQALPPEPVDATDPQRASGLARDAGRAVLALPPRERAAVILKDLFDMSLEETAVVLETTVGAVKAALHRGRQQLGSAAGPAEARPRPSENLVDRFVELYNAADREGMISLIVGNATVSNIGVGTQYGEESLRGKHSWIEGSLGGHPDWPEAFRHEAVRAARADYEGEPIVLVFCTRRDEEALEGVVRLQEEDGRVAGLLSYSFCPETVRAIGDELELPVRTGLYRYPTPAPGRSYRED